MYHFFKSSLQKDIIIPTTPEVYFLPKTCLLSHR